MEVEGACVPIVSLTDFSQAIQQCRSDMRIGYVAIVRNRFGVYLTLSFATCFLGFQIGQDLVVQDLVRPGGETALDFYVPEAFQNCHKCLLGNLLRILLVPYSMVADEAESYGQLLEKSLFGF